MNIEIGYSAMDKHEELSRQRQALKQEIEAEDGRDSLHDSSGRLRDRNPAAPDLDLVMDIPVRITLEVGGSDMSIRELLQLHQGAVVELDRLAGDPLDVLVNGILIARGEVVVVEDKLAFRLTEVVSPAERLQSLR
jgi:flagellar motor switch protein FliN/FliY